MILTYEKRIFNLKNIWVKILSKIIWLS